MTILYTLTAPKDMAISADAPNTAIRLKAGMSVSGTEMIGTKLHCTLQGVSVWIDTKNGTLTQSGAVDPPPTPDPDPVPAPEKDIEVTIHVSPITGIITVWLKSLNGDIDKNDIVLIVNEGEIVI